MKKIILALIILSVSLYATDVNDVLNKNYKARGGLSKIQSVESLFIEGKIYYTMVGEWAPMKYWAKGEKKFKLVQTISVQNSINTITAAYDGKVLWNINPMESGIKPVIVQASKAAVLKGQLEQVRRFIIGMSLTEKITKQKYTGLEKVDGKDAHRIDITNDMYKTFSLFYDAKTNLLSKISTSERDTRSGSEFTVDIIIKENQTVGGIIFPKKYDIMINGQVQQKFEVSKLEINSKIDNSIFTMPK